MDSTSEPRRWWARRWSASVAIGYVEDSILPRLYREAPLNSIWEGSGNVICVDVLRPIHREPETAEALLDEVAQAGGVDGRLDAALERLRLELASGAHPEENARSLVEQMATALQGSLLVRLGGPRAADALCATRLSGDAGRLFGTLPAGLDQGAIVASATLELGSATHLSPHA